MTIIIMVNFMGCSDMFENPYPWPGDLEIEEQESKPDLDNPIVKNPENSPGEIAKDNIFTIFQIEQQYKQDCLSYALALKVQIPRLYLHCFHRLQ